MLHKLTPFLLWLLIWKLLNKQMVLISCKNLNHIQNELFTVKATSYLKAKDNYRVGVFFLFQHWNENDFQTPQVPVNVT